MVFFGRMVHQKIKQKIEASRLQGFGGLPKSMATKINSTTKVHGNSSFEIAISFFRKVYGKVTIVSPLDLTRLPGELANGFQCLERLTAGDFQTRGNDVCHSEGSFMGFNGQRCGFLNLLWVTLPESERPVWPLENRHRSVYPKGKDHLPSINFQVRKEVPGFFLGASFG